jgi:hypothetical protein
LTVAPPEDTVSLDEEPIDVSSPYTPSAADVCSREGADVCSREGADVCSREGAGV